MACNYLWFLKSNSMLQKNAICHNPVWPGLFLGYMCDNDHDGCYKFGPRNTYDFIALILALFFSTWVFNFGSFHSHFTQLNIKVLLPLYRVLAMWTVRAIMNSLKKSWCSPSPCLWWLLRVLSQWAGRRKLKWRQVTWVFHHTLLINNINYFINI